MSIDVTGIDKAAFAKAVYELSEAQGLGFIHMTPGPLSDKEAQAIARVDCFAMDYVLGRACKMYIHEKDGKFTIDDTWYDHTDEQFDNLLRQFGLSRPGQSKHSGACACDECSPHGDHRNKAAVRDNFAHKPGIQAALDANPN